MLTRQGLERISDRVKIHKLAQLAGVNSSTIRSMMTDKTELKEYNAHLLEAALRRLIRDLEDVLK